MEFDRRYRQLNDAQRKAVDSIDGPVMVIAGPGTGKTELLSVRIANILKKTDTLPESILCLTFTESGAAAMRERLVGIIGKEAYKVAIHTFHSFGTEIINTHREFFYNNALFSPADELAQYQILRAIFEELDYKNPLAATKNGEYTYLYDARAVISELKRAGGMTSDELLALISQDEQSLDAIDRLVLPIFSNRIGKTTAAELHKIMPEIQTIAEQTDSLYEVMPLVKILASSLQQALQDSNEQNGSTKPITAWKNSWTGKDDQKNPVFKDRERLAKLKSLSFIYYEYIRRMEEAGLYDYDDMILQVVHAMEVYPELRYNLQEQYLYLMVDEFQDTNIAQMRILHNLTDNPVNEGAPNILTVGDDDQAVYGFQGADVSNILHFREQFPSTELIVLTDNYRSGASILDTSRRVIQQGTDRLEARIPEIDKTLQAQRTEQGEVELIQHQSVVLERQWVASQIKSAREADPSLKIAILGRKHQDLQQMVPYLHAAGLPVRYEKQDNALEQPPILALELFARFIVALATGRHSQANALLPELLAHPAWGVAPKDLWKLSLNSYESRQHWMTAMETTPAFTEIHSFLVDLAAAFHTTSLESMLDRLMGRPDSVSTSPLFEYYFGDKALSENPENYMDYLAALQVIRSRLHEYKIGSKATLQTFVEFIETYRRLGLVISTPRHSLSEKESAVDLLTAHKAKGLEFDHVYIINTIDSKWGQSARTRPRSIVYPANLPLAPAGDTADERLRLFYVAMTRAKRRLTLSFSSSDERDKPSLVADFITEAAIDSQAAPAITIEERVQATVNAWQEPLQTVTTELRDILGPRLDTYRLSATALTSFLDISSGGPRAFLLKHLLRFPHASSLAISYGNAVHYALQQAHTHVLANGERRPLEDTLHDFEEALKKERLDEADLAAGLQKGSEQLPIFLASPLVRFTKDQRAELPFAHQNVQIGEARLTGKIDVVDIDSKAKTMTITDYKTGKPPTDWKGSKEYEKQKLHRYQQQLLFYAILIGGSRDYHNFSIDSGHVAFVQPTKSGEITILDMQFSQDELDRTAKLIEAVWRRIMTLDLPDTSTYPDTLEGVLAFEQDLIDGLTL